MASLAISNTSPLLYLYRIDALDLLPGLFKRIWVPHAVARELSEGRQRGYGVPDPQASSGVACWPWPAKHETFRRC